MLRRLLLAVALVGSACAAGPRRTNVAVEPATTTDQTSPSAESSTSITLLPTSTIVAKPPARLQPPQPTRPVVTTTTTAPLSQAQPPSLTAKPSAGLPERAYVQLTGSGLREHVNGPPDTSGRDHSWVWIYQCPAENPRWDTCDRESYWSTGGDFFGADHTGALTPQALPIHRVIQGRDCATSPGCVLAAFISPVNDTPDAVTPVSFSGPPGPERPVTFAADPVKELRDGQQIHFVAENVMAHYRFSLQECADVGQRSVCDTIFEVADNPGRIDTSVSVRSTLSEDGEVVDCKSAMCRLGGRFQTDQPTVSLGFAP